MRQYLKNGLEIFGIISALLVSYYELREIIPADPIIVLEVQKLKTPHNAPAYLLTGVVSNQDYLLESVKLVPYSENPVRQAIFQYDKYTDDVELIKIKSTDPYTYLISRDLLQKKFEEDSSFSFAFLDKERFTFYFQFEGSEQEKVKFECQMFTVNNHNIPCKVRETGYLSLLRGIPWYFLAIFGGIFLIVVIEVIDLFLKRGHSSRGLSKKAKKKRNKLISEQD
ncbi:hypothetical protein [Candidatus Parabeggiatoa sp. HSG14]|uniref:hypothetical protein n=1 Tax=Candidatus Parabeggiatoa sp. HSG14 TaxID=3055593 RepID=UPI0025A830BD|nr:hypothetical protein [Thiotrichales bacterium HSG14]